MHRTILCIVLVVGYVERGLNAHQVEAVEMKYVLLCIVRKTPDPGGVRLRSMEGRRERGFISLGVLTSTNILCRLPGGPQLLRVEVRGSDLESDAHFHSLWRVSGKKKNQAESEHLKYSEQKSSRVGERRENLNPAHD